MTICIILFMYRENSKFCFMKFLGQHLFIEVFIKYLLLYTSIDLAIVCPTSGSQNVFKY